MNINKTMWQILSAYRIEINFAVSNSTIPSKNQNQKTFHKLQSLNS